MPLADGGTSTNKGCGWPEVPRPPNNWVAPNVEASLIHSLLVNFIPSLSGIESAAIYCALAPGCLACASAVSFWTISCSLLPSAGRFKR